MKICCIGSSHVTALKDSLDTNMKNQIDHEVTFFASYQGDFYPINENLYIKNDNILFSDELLRKRIKFTSNKDYLDIMNYDLIIVYGFIGVFFFNENKYTKSVLNLALNFTYQNYWMFHQFNQLINIIRKLSNKKIIVGLIPNVIKNWNDDNTVSKKNLYIDSFQILKKHYQKYDNVIFIPQPSNTIENEIFTFQEFNKSATQYDYEGIQKFLPEWDISHMNGLYGDNWWKEVKRFLK